MGRGVGLPQTRNLHLQPPPSFAQSVPLLRSAQSSADLHLFTDPFEKTPPLRNMQFKTIFFFLTLFAAGALAAPAAEPDADKPIYWYIKSFLLYD